MTVMFKRILRKAKSLVYGIKIDYLLIIIAIFGVLSVAIYLIVAGKKPGTVGNWWQWVLTSVLALTLIYVIVRIVKSTKDRKATRRPFKGSRGIKWKRRRFSLKWLWIPVVIIAVFLGYKYIPLLSNKHSGSNQGDYTSTPTPTFNLNSVNHMKKGVRVTFFQPFDGELYDFAPSVTGTIVYTIVKAENGTRTWNVEKTKDSKGKITEKRHPDLEPYNDAKRGRSYIYLDRDADVVVIK